MKRLSRERNLSAFRQRTEAIKEMESFEKTESLSSLKTSNVSLQDQKSIRAIQFLGTLSHEVFNFFSLGRDSLGSVLVDSPESFLLNNCE